jgi:ribosomal protein S18 acetylase RimI-like enzyme
MTTNYPDLATPSGTLGFLPATRDDWDSLFTLRRLAMHGHIGVLDQVDNERVRQSFFAGIQNDQNRHILLDEKNIGFVSLRRVEHKLWLSQLHLHPDYHDHGLGSIVLDHVCAEADAEGLPLHVATLKTSSANRFYQRHGFVKFGEDKWENFYRRPVPNTDKATN